LTVPDTNIFIVETIPTETITVGSKIKQRTRKFQLKINLLEKKGPKRKGVNETKDALESSKEDSNQSTDGSMLYRHIQKTIMILQ
jgi:hypothetical protein